MGSLFSAIGQMVAPEAVGDDIQVMARDRQPVRPMEALLPPPNPDAEPRAPMRLNNREFIQQALEDERKSRPGVREGDAQRTGLFGVKGTLRDVLGTLGDAFLIQSGNKPIYGPRRGQEKLADAMAGFTQEDDPRAAIERIAALPGGAEFAQKMFENVIDARTKQQNVQSLEASRMDSASKARADKIDKFTTKFGQMLNGAKSEEQRQAVLRLAGKTAESIGLTLEDIGVGDSLTPEEAEAFVSGATTVNQQNTLPLARERVDIARENAESNRIRATKPPTPRTPARVSAIERVRDKIAAGEKLSAGEQQLYSDSLPKSRGRGRRATTGSTGSPAGWGKASVIK